MLKGTGVYCERCTSQKLAELSGTGLLIKAHAHGQYHEAGLGAREVLELLAGTQDGSAIARFVEGVL